MGFSAMGTKPKSIVGNKTCKVAWGTKAVPRRDNWGGVYSYIRVLPDGFLLKAIVFTVCEHEYMNTHPLSRLVTAPLRTRNLPTWETVNKR